jgi:outer membrane protein TolC
MKKRPVWPSALAVTLQLCWVHPTSCAAQDPTSAQTTKTATTTANPAPRGARAELPASTAGPGGRTLTRQLLPPPLSLPSSVSSDIARFAKLKGGNLPPPIPPRAINASADQSGRAAPSALPLMPAPTVRSFGTGDAAGMSRSPLATRVTLKAAPFDTTDVRFPINLATALRLSDARPLIVAAAQARTWIAEAELTQAKALWIPELNMGASYIRHDGGGPDFNKGVMTFPSVNFFYAGAGLYGLIATTDAFYEPLVARQILNSRQWDIQTAKNDALLQTAATYFGVHQYRGMYAAALYTVERAHDVLARITSLSRDLVSEFEVDRARNMLADLEQQAVSARQQWRVQSARLTKVLRLDPRAVVEPLEHDHAQITLIDPNRALDDLMPFALNNRPEVAARRALIEAADARVRREKARPLLPTVLLNGFQTPGGMLLQGGVFGLGPNSSLNQWVGRDDVSIQLIWQLESFGMGNLARIKAQRGLQSKAIIDLRNTQDRVAEEVNQAQARLQSAAARVSQADRALRTGIVTLNGAVEGLQHTSRFGDELVLITRPQEAIYALQLLKQAFDEYFGTVAEYNRAQFELFHALGYPAREVARFEPAGQVLPVDTTRPTYLPPVGNGPPPATR